MELDAECEALKSALKGKEKGEQLTNLILMKSKR